MQLVSSADVRDADRAAERMGVPPGRLMDAAGRAVAADARAAWPDRWRPLILCGPGNNGGDGYVAARALAEAGATPTVLALTPDRSSGEAAEAARRAWLAAGPIIPLDRDALDDALTVGDLVVDALFGAGLTRPLEGRAAEAVARLARWHGPVLAVDVPSGVDADRAVPPGAHLNAARTVQLATACAASALAPARFAFGAWTVADIGLPAGALPSRARPELITDACAADALPRRDPSAHKYDAGTVLIIGGSARWAGAAELACRGAHRGGAGLVTLIAPATFPARWPETVVVATEDERGAMARAAAEVERRHAAARVFGPGLESRDARTLGAAIAASDAPTVLDAGALQPDLIDAVRAHGRCWLTPHVGEAARLSGHAASDVAADPVGCAVELAAAWNAGVVLKGAGAVVCDPSGTVRIVTAGHPGMASGGTGDVLAGLLGAALAAAHDDALGRVAAAVHLHGRAGERAARRLGVGLRAAELADAVPTARRALGGAW